MGRVYNFSAGPAMLPEEVLKTAQAELLDYHGTGMSVMEMSHRSKAFDDIIKKAEADFRTLVGVPDNYKVLFLQGGGWTQFAEVPMNLMKHHKAGYIVTGNWAKKAYEEAGKYGEAVKLASSEDKNYTYIPDCSDLPITPDMDYVYICENNTIYGTEYFKLPNTKGVDLVADVSSCFLSRPIDVKKYGLFFGGVQKNVGPAGCAIVVIRDDLIRDDLPDYVPTMLRYKTQADKDSLFNTPPCWQIYICGLVFQWLLKNGGLTAMAQKNEAKAKIFYDYLDESKLFTGTVRKQDRSLMNAPFVTGDKDLDAEFVREAAEQGLVSLKGHRTVGGMRASMYNAMPVEGVEKLVAFMKEFEAKHQ
ncbi:MAG TPA: 3-phosphoserine/phosphohydroxythreonine aminotransferase [Lachnospiraceae bacterium]|jgi:phosphoserine aminotransferase|nr:3-phosphoserine/phosphohydroxythreonine aminotransferase [Lachnospiraceae bacterium]